MVDMLINRDQEQKADAASGYGAFSEDGKEFIITSTATPVPWVNVLSNANFCSLNSQNAQGFSFYLDPVRNRITRWNPDAMPLQRQGRYIFIKDDETSEIWTVNGLPCETPYDSWTAHHGLGYTTLKALYQDIESTVTYFVPVSHPAEIWMGTIHNKGSRSRTINIYSSVELVMGNALDDVLMKDYYSLFNVVIFNKGTILGTRNQWTKRDQLQVGKSPGNLVWNMKFFFTTSLPIESYECDRDNFYGISSSLFKPAALLREKLKNSSAMGKDAMAVLHSKILLEPGESKPFVVIMGVHSRNEDSPAFIEELKNYEHAAESLNVVKEHWNSICESVWIETPDRDINRAFNYWLKYQVLNLLTWGDNCAIHESGKAEFPTRDLIQNLFTLLSLSPELCRKKILELTAYQYFDGDFSHAIVPLIERGSRSGHSDHQLWLPYLVSQYCRETDDMSILTEIVPYHDRGEARLMDHCIRAIEFVLGRKSARGLPLILNGDWNEALDHLGREGKGESVWLAMFIVYVMKRFIVLFTDSHTHQIKEKFLREIESLTTAINTHAWDGEWYHRAFTDDGRPVGSEKCEKGQIFLLPQAWAVISGTAPRERGRKALESVLKHLDSPEGTMAMFPPYVQPDQSIGIITRYAAGKRENGGILKTPAIWRIMAESLYGNGNKAFKLLKKHMNAVYSAADPQRFKAEPYFESEYVDGIESSECGMGSFSHRGCSASWIFRLIHDWICGIRLEQRGMKIDPSIPGEWERFVIKKLYRGATYEITVENPHRLQKGVGAIYVDDQAFSGSFIPIFGDGKIHKVRVIIGKEDASLQPSYDTAAVEQAPETAQAEPAEAFIAHEESVTPPDGDDGLFTLEAGAVPPPPESLFEQVAEEVDDASAPPMPSAEEEDKREEALPGEDEEGEEKK